MPSTEIVPWYRADKLTSIDTYWMHRALALAKSALPDDMPFGCVIVAPDGKTELAATWGTGNHDPLAHSEMVAIHLVAHNFKEPEWLQGCSIYSSAEPCGMCSGGINHAKLSRVIFGSYRQDLPHLFRPKRPVFAHLAETSHPPVVIGGVLREQCVQVFDGLGKWD